MRIKEWITIGVTICSAAVFALFPNFMTGVVAFGCLCLWPLSYFLGSKE